MRSKALKILFTILFVLTLGALLMVNGVLIWVATGPRALTQLTPYLEAQLNAPGGSYRVKIGGTVLMWDGWRHPVDARLRNVELFTREGELFAAFPEISLDIDLLSLPLGRVQLQAIVIKKPVISLFQASDGSISLGSLALSREAGSAPGPLALLLGEGEGGPLESIRSIAIEDADVSIGSFEKGVVFNAQKVNAALKKTRQGRRFTLRTDLRGEKLLSHLQLEIVSSRNARNISGKVQFARLLPSMMRDVLPGVEALGWVDLPLSGWGDFTFDREGKLIRADLVMDGGPGVFQGTFLEQPLAIRRMEAEGHVADNWRSVEIKKFGIEAEKMQVLARGSAAIGNDGEVTADLRAEVRGVPGDDVRLLWPPSQAPISREWVVENITGGSVPLATVELRLKPGDLALPALPEEAVDAVIEIDNASLRYLPEHPPVTDVKGIVRVTGKALTAEIQQGRHLSGTELANGTVLIPDLNEDNPYITVTFDASAPASDIARFLELPPLSRAKRLGIDRETVGGAIDGHAKLGFYYFAPRKPDGSLPDDLGVDHEITAQLKEVSQPGFLGRYGIRQANGKLLLDNRHVEFQGRAEVNGVPGALGVVHHLVGAGQFDTLLDIKGEVPVTALPAFGYKDTPFKEGSFLLEAKVKQGDGIEETEAAMNLEKTRVELPLAGFSKPAGKPAALRLSSHSANDKVELSALDLEGEGMRLKGSGVFSKGFADTLSISLAPMRYGENDLERLSYRALEGGFGINASGRVFDVRPYLEREGEEFSFARFPAVDIALDVGRIILGDERELHEVKGYLRCDRLCREAKLDGNTPGGKLFDLRIVSTGRAERQLAASAKDGGALLKALDIVKSVNGGELILTGTFNDNAENHPLTGKLKLMDYTLRDAPVLTKLLALASLGGILDALQGNGISFSKLAVNYALANDVITLGDGKMYGSSIGLTAEGKIVFPGAKLDLEGTLVPSYMLNSLLGKVPILGQVLAGGEGEGVFAANYSMRGSAEDPEVLVNPLSMLTPGFLRGLFDVFDTSKEEGKGEEIQR